MNTLTLNSKVAKSAQQGRNYKNEYKVGVLVKINRDKGLVKFDSGAASWCNIINLENIS
jgi:hypothetical protein